MTYMDIQMSDTERVGLVYVVQQRSDGRYVLLNRDYAPVGTRSREAVVYEKLRGFTIDLSPSDAAQISHNRDPNTSSVYLYNDACKPWDSRENRAEYFRRHDILAACIDRTKVW